MAGWRRDRIRGVPVMTRRVVAAVILCLLALMPVARAQAPDTPPAFRVALPRDGASGLRPGAEVEVLGVPAGSVRRILFGADRRLVAEIDLREPAARDFIRRDSPVAIRQRRGADGAVFLNIGPADGPPLDAAATLLVAVREPPPPDPMVLLLDELRERVFPIIEDVGRTTRSFGQVVARIELGEGTLGRLLTSDTFARTAEDAARDAATVVDAANRLIGRMDAIAAEAERLLTESRGEGGTVIPGLVRRVEQLLATVQNAARDVNQTTARLPRTLRNIEDSTGTLPGLLLQTQQATRQLELLLTQLRGMWLLGGDGPPPRDATRPPAERLRP